MKSHEQPPLSYGFPMVYSPDSEENHLIVDPPFSELPRLAGIGSRVAAGALGSRVDGSRVDMSVCISTTIGLMVEHGRTM